MVMRMMRLPDGRLKVLVQGLSKIRVTQFLRTEPHIDVDDRGARPPSRAARSRVEVEALVRGVREKLEELLPLKHLPPEILAVTGSVDDPGRLADLVASNLRLRVEEAQEILEILDPVRRLRKIDALLRRELAVTLRAGRDPDAPRARSCRATSASSSCASRCARSRTSSARAPTASPSRTSCARASRAPA